MDVCDGMRALVGGCAYVGACECVGVFPLQLLYGVCNLYVYKLCLYLLVFIHKLALFMLVNMFKRMIYGGNKSIIKVCFILSRFLQ